MKKFVFWLILNILLVIFVGFFDLATGPEISFSLFYLVPIALASWFIGRKWGIIISLLSAGIWFWAEFLTYPSYSNEIIRFWNTGIRLGFFLVVTSLIARLKIALLIEQELAKIDGLTGVANSRHFHSLVEDELLRSRRFHRAISIVYIDLDNFKFINDHYGHDIGDQVIQLAALTMCRTIRNIDRIGRLGGDEFAIILPETNQENAGKAVTRIQQNLLSAMKNHQWPVTTSIGVITSEENECSVNQLLKDADNLMYLAKQEGKNTIRYGNHNQKTESGEADPVAG